MKKIIFSAILAVLVVCGVALSEYFPDVIVTSPNGAWTDTRAYTTIDAAITAIGANVRDLYIVEQEATVALNIPANAHLHFLGSGSIANTGQLDINTTSISAGNKQIFTGTGDIDWVAGSIVRTTWFSDLDEAFDVTLDDTLIMVVAEADTLPDDCVVGDKVTLRWESPFILTSTGFNLTNLKKIEAGCYQLFGASAADDFDWLAGSVVNSSWFIDIYESIVLTSDENVELTILVDEPETLDTNCTVDTYQTLEVKKGCIISIDSGIDLLINGPFIAGLYQTFNPADVTATALFGAGVISNVNVKWWNATGDNATDDTAAIDAAIAAANNSNATLSLPPGIYRVVPGGLANIITCPVYGPQASIGAYDNTNSNLIKVRYAGKFATFELQCLLGYDVTNAGTYDNTITPSGIGFRQEQSHYSWIKISRIVGFNYGLYLDGFSNDDHIANCNYEIGEIRHNETGIILYAGASYAVECNRFEIGYFYDNETANIYVNGGFGVTSNYFSVLALEGSPDVTDTNGIVLNDATTTRNVFRIFHMSPLTPGTGEHIKCVGAHDNLFQLPNVDFANITMNAANVFDTHSIGVSNQLTNIAARSMTRGDAAPVAGYHRDGDIQLNDSPSDGTLGWVCIVSGNPGTWAPLKVGWEVIAVDAGTGGADTYTILEADLPAVYVFDIDALTSDAYVNLPEASTCNGDELIVYLQSADASHDLLVDPDAGDHIVTTTAAGDYIGADGADEYVHLMAVSDGKWIILNSDGALPTGWVEE